MESFMTIVFVVLCLVVGGLIYKATTEYSISEYKEYVVAVEAGEKVELGTWAGFGKALVTDRSDQKGELSERTVAFWFSVIAAAFLLGGCAAIFGVIQMIRSPEESA